MKIDLTSDQKKFLEDQHRASKDRRIADRIKAVLLFAEGWTQPQIAQALRIHSDTVLNHLQDYRNSKKLKSESGGSSSKLNADQTKELISHLEKTTYVKVSDICIHIEKVYNSLYTVSGITKWLHAHDFSFKKPKGVPAKADILRQAEFEKAYRKLLEEKAPEEPVIFGDGVHPTMATKVTYGWIRKGKDKTIATTASRTRMNLFGGIDLKTMNVVIDDFKTLNSDSIVDYFKKLKSAYPDAKTIHLILDQGSYNTSLQTREAALESGIKIHYLPPYSPNLNPIERLWKVMNEYVRNNRFFEKAKEFRKSILNFFEVTWPEIALSMKNRINDNFQSLKPEV